MKGFEIADWPRRRLTVLIHSVSTMIVAGLVTGCAFSNVPVNLPTQPTTGYSGGDNRVLVVPKFLDERQIKDRIGMQKNSYGMDTANAVPDQNVDEWLAARLAAELRAVAARVFPGA